MLTPSHDLFKALGHARRAMRSGDPAAAERWMRIAERHLAVHQRLNQMADAPSPQEEAESGPKLPVMVDPKGYSPGGTENRWINFERLKRAGLDPTMAEKLWQEQQAQKKR